MTIFRKSSLAAVFAAWLAAGNNVFADGDLQLLWWSIGGIGGDNAVELSKIDVQNPDGTSAGTALDLGVNAARVRVVDGAYLDTSDMESWPEMFSPPGDPYLIPLEALADITSYASPEYYFVVELGNWNRSNNDWTTKAKSESISYEQLQDAGYLKTFSNGKWGPEGQTYWAPTTYVVPEPSGGLLVLLGAAGLLLRRRRKFRA